MKYKTVYIILNNKEAIFANESRSAAKKYEKCMRQNGINKTLSDWGVDDDDVSTETIGLAAYQAGYDGDYYVTRKIDLSQYSEDDTIKLDEADVEVSDILKLLEEDRFSSE